MRRHTVHRQKGFTYLMLLWWVAISGVIMMAVAQSWSMEARRQREAELLFRGEQIKKALQAYHEAQPQSAQPFPLSLADLLEDRRGAQTLRHLRRPYTDPLTVSGEWGLIKQDGRIRGVFSTSRQMPVKSLDPHTTYQDLRFEVEAAEAPASAASGASAAASAAAAAKAASAVAGSP